MEFDVLILPFEPNELGFSYRVSALTDLVVDDKFVNVVVDFTQSEFTDLGSSVGFVTDLVLKSDGVHGKLKFHGKVAELVTYLVNQGLDIEPKLVPALIGTCDDNKVISNIERLVELKLASLA